MSDDNAPPGSGDRTIIRPKPGGRAAAPRSPAPGVAPPPSPGSNHAQPAYAPPSAAAPSGGGFSAAPAQDLKSFGTTALNPLVEAAMPLLMLCGALRGTREHTDVAGLHAETVRQVQGFEQAANDRSVSQESVLAARYGLCTFIDEVVMNTPWGANSIWPGRSLLLTFHRDNAGGQKVFQMIERVLADRDPRRDLVEFFYVCLALGLQGQYRVTEGGQAKLADVRERLYARIKGWREAPPDELSPAWQGVQDRRNRLVRTLPAWVCVTLVVLVGSGTFFGFHNSLNSATAPLNAQLNQVRQATFESPVGPAAIRGVDLAELLRDIDSQRVLMESGEGGRTTVILRGEVFGSGSIDVTAEFQPILRRIGEALQQVPGNVQVEGHSDDVPIRSVRFPNNYVLSEARAASAAEILRGPLSDPGRVSHVGVGEDRPRHEPVNTPANRALNRRIEIVHRAGGLGS